MNNTEQNKPQESKPIESYRAAVSETGSLYSAIAGSMLSLTSSVHLEADKEILDPPNEYKGERTVQKESENLAGSWKAYAIYIRLGSGWSVGPILIVIFILVQALFR